MEYLLQAGVAAIKSTCQRSRCGSIIVNADAIIGTGFNSPPGNLEEQRRCASPKEAYHLKVTDKTCCMHAEERAIMDALRRNPDALAGSRLYFMRIDEACWPARSGEPYCTLCSKMALDAGIGEFVLWQEQGVCVYQTGEYNLLSFQYRK